MNATTDREYCPTEDASGRRCTFGPGHKGTCKFTTYRPTPNQIAVLEDIAAVEPAIRRLVCIGLTTVASLRALNDRGYIRLSYVSSRAWNAALTPAGRRLLDYLPR